MIIRIDDLHDHREIEAYLDGKKVALLDNFSYDFIYEFGNIYPTIDFKFSIFTKPQKANPTIDETNLVREEKHKMDSKEAEIIVLKDELEKCYNTIEFLHDRLTHRKSYTYPEQTEEIEDILKNILYFIGEDYYTKYCHHSSNINNCETCKKMTKYRERVYKAKQILGIQNG